MYFLYEIFIYADKIADIKISITHKRCVFSHDDDFQRIVNIAHVNQRIIAVIFRIVIFS
jgi:hypothetical protein